MLLSKSVSRRAGVCRFPILPWCTHGHDRSANLCGGGSRRMLRCPFLRVAIHRGRGRPGEADEERACDRRDVRTESDPSERTLPPASPVPVASGRSLRSKQRLRRMPLPPRTQTRSYTQAARRLDPPSPHNAVFAPHASGACSVPLLTPRTRSLVIPLVTPLALTPAPTPNWSAPLQDLPSYRQGGGGRHHVQRHAHVSESQPRGAPARGYGRRSA